MNLDTLDKKILNVLNQDVRAPYTKIAKRVHSSKEVVNYRIKRLEESKIINNYITIFDLGYWANKIKIQFQKITPMEEKEILKFLSEHNYVNWVTPCSGSSDLIFVVMAHNPEKLDSTLREILKKIGKYVLDYQMATSIGSDTFGHTYLLGTIKESKRKNKKKSNVFLDDKDKQICKILQKDARSRLIDIYKRTKIPVDTIKYRIQKLELSGIIKRYRLILNPTKMGYTRFEIFIRGNNLSEKVILQFREFAKQNVNVEHFTKFVGSWDIEFTVIFKTFSEFREFVFEIKEKFGEYISSLESIILFKTLNYVYSPSEINP